MRMRWFLLLLAAVPALEIWILIEVGSRIGGWQTFGLLVLIGAAGVVLVRREARRVLDYARYEWSRGVIPTASLLDGICVFAGGLLLVTPGFLSDVLGLALILPGTRHLLKRGLYRILMRLIESGRFRFSYWR